MFGLLRVPKGYLSPDEFEQFQAHYCGVCHALARCGSQGFRLALSYDAAALTMLVSAFAGGEVLIERKPCPFSPWRRKPMATGPGEVFDFAAKASLGLVKLKAEDEILDGAGLVRRWAMQVLARYVKAPSWPEFEETGTLQREAEENPAPWLDELLYPTGFLLGSIATRAAAAYGREEETAYKLGENLGKWIYLWDALWDFEDDCASGRFNALSAAYPLETKQVRGLDPQLMSELDFVLERSLAEVIRNLRRLDLGATGEILAKLIRGAHGWHKNTFVKEFFRGEIDDERLPLSWRSRSCPHSASAGRGVGIQD